MYHWAYLHLAAAAAKSLQSCPILCDPIDGSPPGSPVPGILHAGVGCHFLLQCVKVRSLSRVQPSATPWTAAYQAPPSMGFFRQEYWSGLDKCKLKSFCKITDLDSYNVNFMKEFFLKAGELL